MTESRDGACSYMEVQLPLSSRVPMGRDSSGGRPLLMGSKWVPSILGSCLGSTLWSPACRAHPRVWSSGLKDGTPSKSVYCLLS